MKAIACVCLLYTSLAEGVGSLKLQSMGETLLKHHLQCVVVGVGNGVFGKNVVEDRDPVYGATRSGRKRSRQRIAIRRGIRAQSYEVDGLVGAVDGAAVRHVEQEARRNGHAPLRIFDCLTTIGLSAIGIYVRGTDRRDAHDIEAGLRRGGIDVVTGQQAMSLGPDIADLEHRAVAQLTLDGEVVLSGVLRAQVGSEFSIKKDRAKQRQIRGLTLSGRDNPAEGVRTLEVELIDERSV